MSEEIRPDLTLNMKREWFEKVSKELCEKARELGKMVAITDKTGLPPMELLGLYSMCQAIDNFLTVFEKGEPKYGEGGAK